MAARKFAKKYILDADKSGYSGWENHKRIRNERKSKKDLFDLCFGLFRPFPCVSAQICVLKKIERIPP
jgi:hypothetical protein